MNVKELREMINLMNDHGLTELEVEKEGERIRLKKQDIQGAIIREELANAAAAASVPAPLPKAEGESAPAPAAPANFHEVKSPMVGSFYSSPAPDQDPYVTKGQTVKEGDVLCIVEAMKLMNEIKSEVSGKVLEVLVENGQPVEFDQPLFSIEKTG